MINKELWSAWNQCNFVYDWWYS